MPAVVSLLKCPTYGEVPDALERLLQGLGGMHRYVQPGQSVLIKPNLLSDHTPDDAVTTHPELVRAIIRQVKRAGGIPRVADSPANAVQLARVWERTGIGAVCAQEDTELINLEKAGSTRIHSHGFDLMIARPVLEAPVIINVPKIKTHVLTMLTGAVKNMYGVIPGFQKTTLHKLYSRPEDFGRMLAALYAHVRPTLTIADAVVGMDGEGPSAGRPCPLGLLAASADAVALDAVLCRLLHIPLANVPLFAPLRQWRLGETEEPNITLCGDPLDTLQLPAFRLPSTLPLGRIPRWLVRLLQPLIWTRPHFTSQCIHCGQCLRACPAGALHAGPREIPVLNSKLCLECCCCHEVCPVHAIEMRLSPFMMLVRRRRHP